MKFIPAIDLKDNKCVRLYKGKEESSKVFNDSPIQQAKFFEKQGCERIHIVDLDGAFGRPNINKKTIIKIRKNIKTPIQLGGGIKDKEDISFWIKEGIDFLVIGSLAIKNSELILKMSYENKNKIYVSLDVLNDKVMIKGWVEDSNILCDDIFNIYNKSHVNGYILTDISRDGTMEGLDFSLLKKLAVKTKKNIIFGGGLSNYSDLDNARRLGSDYSHVEGVIAGKSFYLGNIAIDKAKKTLKKNN